MARTDTLEHFLTDVADSIRTKKGTSGTISAPTFDTEIASISGGGGSSTYTKSGINSFTIEPIDSQYVTNAYIGTASADAYLRNCPSLSDLYSLFYDKYISTDENYTVTKTSLGKDQSDTYDIYEYDFCPKNWNRLILLTSGMHSFEINALFGLAYFMESVMEHYSNNDMLTYIHNNVRIKVIPLINPWGYSQSPKVYAQSRGVNINRNFDYNGVWDAFPTYSNVVGSSNYNAWNYKGEEPFSEAETRILKDWLEQNYGTEFWIDCHTGGGTTLKDHDIYTYSLSTSPYASKISSAQTKLAEWTKSFYGVSDVRMYAVLDSETSVKQKWCEGKYGVPMLVIEQSTDNALLGYQKAGDKNGFINYYVQILGYVGEFLLRNPETVNSNEYIESLQQLAITNKKYQTPYSNAPTPIVLESISATKTVKSYVVGDTLTTDDIVVTATYSNGTTSNVTSSATIDASAVVMSSSGSYVISISYSGKTTTIPISVSNSVTTNELNIYQGGLASATGLSTESATRIYTDYIPVGNTPFQISKDGTVSNLGMSGRMYDDSNNFIVTLQTPKSATFETGYYVSDWSTTCTNGWETANTCTVAKKSSTTLASKTRLLFRYQDDSNITPSDLNGMRITVDGIEYILKA